MLDMKRTLRANEVSTDKLLLDEEVTLPSKGPEIKPLSSPKRMRISKADTRGYWLQCTAPRKEAESCGVQSLLGDNEPGSFCKA